MTCPKYDYQNAGYAGGTQVPVAVTNACVIPRLGQGAGRLRRRRLSGRFDSVSEVPYGIRCASRKSIRMLRDFERTAPPAPSAPGCPALTKGGELHTLRQHSSSNNF